MQFIHGDCLDKMQEIPDGSIDMVMADPPYGTTACKWDSIIPLEPMWKQLKRVIKSNGAIVMTASQPFTSILIMSNIEMFKYCWVWMKTRMCNFPMIKGSPGKIHEDIAVFSFGTIPRHNGTPMVYNPQELKVINKKTTYKYGGDCKFMPNRKLKFKDGIQAYTNYPKSILQISNEDNTAHPTQKPVALMEYLIKTYTNEGETVLDFAMGSGTTGVACFNLNRNFIGIEKIERYVKLAKRRIIMEKYLSERTE